MNTASFFRRRDAAHGDRGPASPLASSPLASSLAASLVLACTVAAEAATDPVPVAGTIVTREMMLKAMNPGLRLGHVEAYEDRLSQTHTWDVITSSDETTLTHLTDQAFNPFPGSPAISRVTIRWSRTADGAIQFADTADLVFNGADQVETMRIGQLGGLVTRDSFFVSDGEAVSEHGASIGVTYSNVYPAAEPTASHEIRLVLGSGTGTSGRFRFCIELDRIGRAGRDMSGQLSCTVHDADGNVVGMQGEYVPFLSPAYRSFASPVVLREAGH